MRKICRIVMAVAGLFLIVAACFKIHQLLTSPLPEEPLIDTWLFAVVQVPLELGLGIWLVSGLFVKAGWLISLIAYGGFVGITTWRFATGQESCGCFGSFHVDPKITLFAIDIPIFLGLAIFRPKGEKLLQWPSAKHFLAIAIPTLIILATIVPTLILNKVTKDTEGIEVINPKEFVTPVEPVPQIDPVDTIDPVNPIYPNTKVEPVEIEPAADEWEHLKKIDIADTIRDGINITVLYRFDCDKCHEAMPLLEEYAEQFGTDVRIALIELPPYGEPEDSPVAVDTKCLTGKYVTEDKVFVSTPVIVVTIDGIAIKAWSGTDEIPTFENLMDAIMEQ